MLSTFAHSLRFRRPLGLALCLTLLSLAPYSAPAGDTEFLRVRNDAKQKPLAMETAIVRYSGTDAQGQPVIVDLIGVVHIGEKDYYEELNERFQEYDALLYELVAPEGPRVPQGGVQSDGSPVSGLQNGMKEMLGLEFQLDHIDYHQDNFVHADMSPDEFVESMNKNDESFAKMFFKMLGSSMAQQGRTNAGEADLLAAMFSDDREIRMRRSMAKQMQSADAAMTVFSGREGSTIIHHRNGKCFEILDREISAGKRRLGVFYGAGHLPDMEDRLLAKGFKKDGETTWLVAWKLTRDEAALQAAAEEPAAGESSATPSAEATDAAESDEAEVADSDSTQVQPAPASNVRRGWLRRGSWRFRGR